MDLRISDFLKPEAIMMEISANNKLEAIRALVDFMAERKIADNREELYRALAKRENLESTGIGDGIAIPHARTDAVKDLILVFARAPGGIDFSAIDGKPSQIIFLIASPENKKSEYIIMLAKLSRMLRKAAVREKLRNAGDPREIIAVIKEHED